MDGNGDDLVVKQEVVFKKDKDYPEHFLHIHLRETDINGHVCDCYFGDMYYFDGQYDRYILRTAMSGRILPENLLIVYTKLAELDHKFNLATWKRYGKRYDKEWRKRQNKINKQIKRQEALDAKARK